MTRSYVESIQSIVIAYFLFCGREWEDVSFQELVEMYQYMHRYGNL